MKNIQRIRRNFHSFLTNINFILTLFFGEVTENQAVYVKAVLPVSNADLLKRASARFETKKRGGAR